MFNFNNNEYALMNIMHSLNRAFNYICREEKSIFNAPVEYKLLTVYKPLDIEFEYQTKYVHICFVESTDYLKLNIWNRIDISQFIIVPMIIN
jgi:hypothetical protein